MAHNSAGVGWEVAGWNFDNWSAVEFAYKALTEKLAVVFGSINGSSDFFLNSVVESWGNPEDTAGSVGAFVKSCAHLQNIAVSIVSGWGVILRNSSSADSSLEQAVLIDSWDNFSSI